MINPFKYFRKDNRGLVNISALQVDDMISKFNIYFSTYDLSVPKYEQTPCVYQLDNLKSFNKQFKDIKKLNAPFDNSVHFYTDFKQNKELIFKRISEANQIIEYRNKRVTVNSLANESRADKYMIAEYLKSKEKYPTKSLFD